MHNVEDLDLIFLIDRSGSMYGSEEDTIGGFNSFIEKEKLKEGNTRVTTILFDHEYEMLYKRKDIDDVNKLTRDEYYVRGSTALLDAIGKTITTLDREIDNKALFVITTDGMENSSVEFSKSQIKSMIQNHNWNSYSLVRILTHIQKQGSLVLKNQGWLIMISPLAVLKKCIALLILHQPA